MVIILKGNLYNQVTEFMFLFIGKFFNNGGIRDW
jgi:hypothetical protein